MKILPPPGPQRRRQLGLLFLMVVLVAAVWMYQFGGFPAASPLPASNSQTGAAAPATTPSAGPAGLPRPVALGQLASDEPPPVAGRNPFRFGVKPAPPPSTTSRPPAVTAPPPPPPPTGPPPIALKLVGLIEWPGTGRTRATLKDPASGALFQAFEGEIVDGRYRLVKVGVQSVVVAYLDGSGQRTIPLGG